MTEQGIPATGESVQPRSSIELRLAAPHEYARVDSLIAEAYEYDYGPSGHGDDPMRLAANRARDYDVWVAVNDAGDLVGSVTTRRAGGPPLHEDVLAEELDLRLLAVSPHHRRLGIGADTMRQVIARTPAAGYRAVALKTGPNMRGAHLLYESLGFSRVPERAGLWIGGERVLDLYTYVLQLS